MRAKSELYQLMQAPLPPIMEQKRLGYRPTLREVKNYYKLINDSIFDGQLVQPEIQLMARCRKYWGMCYGGWTKVPRRNTFCKIRLMDKFYSRSWMISILAHEMVHQYQWDIDGPIRLANGKERILSHGPSFFKFKNRMAEHGIILKVAQRRGKWFKNQDFR